MIIRVKKNKENPYVVLNKKLLNDSQLSWKAKGLLSYLLSLPDDWKINVEDLKKRSKDGRDATRSAINELMRTGYIEREEARDGKGKITGYIYTVMEMPKKAKTPETGNPTSDNPISENPTLLSNEVILSNDSTNYPSSVAEEKRNQSWSRLQDKISVIYTHWCSFGLKKNSEQVLKGKLKKEHYMILDEVEIEKAKEAINNYAEILKLNKEFPPVGQNDGWTHRLEFSAFLWKRKYNSRDETVSWVHEFVNEEDPHGRFLSAAAKYHRKKERMNV